MNKSNFSGPVVLAIVIGLIIGFTAGVVWINSFDKEVEEKVNEKIDSIEEENNESPFLNDVSNTEARNAFVLQTASGVGSVVVSDQVEGDTVTVSSVSIGEDGWIAVRDARDNGLGNILGATYVTEGDYVNKEVKLLRNTESGELYEVILFSDNGDREFNHLVDAVIQKDDVTIADQFLATQ
jgi:hypothetical protein